MKTTLFKSTLIAITTGVLFHVGHPLKAQLVYNWALGFISNTGQVVSCESLVADAFGNVYAAGSFEETVDFDPSPNTFNLTSAGGSDIFLAKYSSSGNLLWAFKIGDTNYDHGYGITLDSSGNIIITGTFRGAVDFDPSPGTATLSILTSWDVFIAKYTPAGNYMWAKSFGGFGNDEGWSIKTDTSKNIFITGVYSQTMDLSPGARTANITSTGATDCFVAKYDSSGNYIWGFGLGGTLDDVAGTIAVDLSGQVYVCGAFRNTADFNPSGGTANLTSAGILDIFIAKYSTSGNYLWANRIGAADEDIATDLSLDPAGNIVVTGSFQLTCDFDPSASVNNLTSAGGPDIFIAKYNPAGNYLWAIGMGSPNIDYGYAVAIDAFGKISIAGSFKDIADFNPGAGTANFTTFGGTDGFIARYNGDGTLIGAYQLGGPNDDITQCIAIGSSAPLSLFTGGYFHGSCDLDPSPNQVILTASSFQSAFLSNYMDATNHQNEMTEIQKKLSVFPNPTSGKLFIHSESDADLKIINVTGKLISIVRLSSGLNRILLENIEGGIYFLIPANPGVETVTQKIVIVK